MQHIKERWKMWSATAIGSAVVVVIAAFVGVALAWVHPTPKGVTCDSGTFVVPKGAHETTPWLANEWVNGVRVFTDFKVMDTATSHAAGTITVPVYVAKDGSTNHVKITVNGPGGYSDGGSTIEADVTCGQPSPPPPPPPAPPAPPVVTTPAPPVAVAPPVRRIQKCEHRTVHGRKVIVCKKKPHKCKYPAIRIQRRVKHGPKKGQKYTVCYRPKPDATPKFTG